MSTGQNGAVLTINLTPQSDIPSNGRVIVTFSSNLFLLPSTGSITSNYSGGSLTITSETFQSSS